MKKFVIRVCLFTVMTGAVVFVSPKPVDAAPPSYVVLDPYAPLWEYFFGIPDISGFVSYWLWHCLSNCDGFVGPLETVVTPPNVSPYGDFID